MESSLCEKPERHASRRLSDYLTLEGQKQKVHSLVDKVYARKNLQLAWERVRANRGASGTDRITIEEFEANLDANLERLHRELRDDTYQPQPVRRLEIPKRGAPGKTRPLGIPTVYDRVCQQALANRLEPIFEKVFDLSSFGYRKGRKTADALTKIWREIQAGSEFTSGLQAGRSPFPLPDITTTSTGLLCCRDLHPMEWQLASLHQHLLPGGPLRPYPGRSLTGWTAPAFVGAFVKSG